MHPSRVLAPLPHRLLLLSLFALTVLATPGGANAQALGPSPAASRSLHLLDSNSEPPRRSWTGDERRADPLDETGTHAYLVYYGLTRGAIHGVLMAGVLELDRGAAAAVIGLGAVGETLAAITLTDGMTPGRAHVIGTGLDFGLIAGIGLDLAAEVPFDWDSAERSKRFIGTPLVLSVAGAFASALLVDAQNLTWGDMELVHMSGLVGGLVGGGALGSSDPRAGVGILAGSAVGLLVGGYLISNRDFSLGQSLVMDLGAVAGGVGGGVATAASGSEGRVVALSAGLGAAVGLGITYLLLSPHAHVEEQKPPVELSLQFSPGSLAAPDTRTGRPAPTSLLLQGRF